MATTQPCRTRPAPAAFDSLEQEAYLQLWRTYDRLRELDERVFQRHGITAQQYNALRILKSVRPGALSTSAGRQPCAGASNGCWKTRVCPP